MPEYGVLLDSCSILLGFFFSAFSIFNCFIYHLRNIKHGKGYVLSTVVHYSIQNLEGLSQVGKDLLTAASFPVALLERELAVQLSPSGIFKQSVLHKSVPNIMKF